MGADRTQQRLVVQRAFFIKLGSKGKWEADCIGNGIMRFGWECNALADIHAGRWDKIRDDLAKTTTNKGTVTNDFNRLKDICGSTPDDVWTTFHASKLYWCRLSDAATQEDDVSKFRRTIDGWHSADITRRELIASQIPGVISKVQGFRGTVCSIDRPDVLERVINGEPSEFEQALDKARNALIDATASAIQQLHWRDFETLVDLVFRAAGWKRTGVLGETNKDVDMELEEPLTREKYQVQVKARASLEEFRDCAASFSPGSFRSFYFVVHSPSDELARFESDDPSVSLIRVNELAEMVVRAGLVDWLMTKVW